MVEEYNDMESVDDLEKTIEVNPISEEELLSDTITDLWSENHE